MAESFSQLCDFKLYIGKKKESDQRIFNYYDISHPFKIIELGLAKLRPRSFFYSFKCLKVIKKEKPDYIYLREPRLAFFLSLFFRNLILEIHSLNDYFFLKQAVKRIKKLIVTTDSLKENLREQEINTEIEIAHNGVDIEMFNVKEGKKDCRERLNIPLNKKIILYIGQFYQWQRVASLFKGAYEFGNFNPKRTTIFLCIGARSQDMERIRQKIHNLNNVVIISSRPYSEIPYWLKAADILVLPDSVKGEPLKYGPSHLKIFEYMASRRPIVASDLSSIREILNENNAILVEPDNPRALAEKIKNILENPQLAEKISNQAFQEVKEYTWQKRAQKILKFISI